MKKVLILFIIFTFGFLVIPINITQAISQNQINAEVQIVCPDNYGNWYSGSGTIIDSKGIILTNRHVVTDQYSGIIDICFIGFIESINQEPNFGTVENPNLAEVKYYTTSEDMDAAILYLNNPTNNTYPYVDIWSSNSNTLKFGDKVEVIGYPSIGGSTITYTSGDFSGFGSYLDGTQNYIKSTAILEHGNSGGAAYDPNGQFIGIPTMVVTGSLNSMSYILSVNSIKSWLSDILGNNYQNEIKIQEPIINQPSNNIQSDITPPVFNGSVQYYFDYNLGFDQIQFYWNSSQATDTSGIKKYYYYFGVNKLANPLIEGASFFAPSSGVVNIPVKFDIRDTEEKYLIIKIEDNSGNITSPMVISYWSIQDMISKREFIDIYNKSKNNIQNTSYYLIDKYKGKFLKDVENDGIIWYLNPKDSKRYLITGKLDNKKYWVSNLNSLIGSSGAISTGITTSDLKKKPRHVWGHLLQEMKDDLSGIAETGCGSGCYIDPKTGKLYYFYLFSGNENDINNTMDIIFSLTTNVNSLEINKIPLSNEPYSYFKYDIENNKIPKYTTQYIIIPDYNLMNNLKGKILLQVESRGEAWYLDPVSKKRFYLRNGEEAYKALRKFGLGITNSDLAKIPIDGSNIKGNQNLVNRLKGRILLQVESKGEAWYLNPKDGKRYYMKDGEAAYQIMRNLSLGITNIDLNKIPIGNL